MAKRHRAQGNIPPPHIRNALLQNVFENAPVPTFLVEADGRLFYANRAFCDLLGYAPAEVVSLGIPAIVHPDDAAAARQQTADLAAGAINGYRAERRYRSKKGDVIWVLVSGSRLVDAQSGKTICITVQAIDIDRQKRAEVALAKSESRWNFALESAGQGVFDHDLIGKRAFYSRMWKQMRGFDPDAEIHDGDGKWLARVHPEDRERMLAVVSQHDPDPLGIRDVEYRERHRDGHWIWIQSRGKCIEWTPDGTPARFIGTDTDITNLKRAEERLRFANTLIKTGMETSLDGMLVVDADSRIVQFNQRFVDMWRIPLELLQAADSAPVQAAIAASVKDTRAFNARLQSIDGHREGVARDELETRDGRYVDRHTGAICTLAGDYLGRIWFFRDISDRRRAEAQLLQAARCDALTGLDNRNAFMTAVQAAIASAAAGGPGFAVLYLDLDQFKDVNDTLGHTVGDLLLKEVAARLRSNTRPIDVVARFGGDEFAVLVRDANEPIKVAQLADRLIEAMRDSFLVDGNDIRSGISIGIALSGSNETEARTLLSHADVALYQAKSAGFGGYRFFTGEMDAEVRTRVTLGGELREAIAGRQLFLLYQPQVEIATGRITGVEALVRWRHPTRGVLGPDLFVPIAEKNGFIGALGNWVLREACRQARAWLDAGMAPETIAVNVSAVQFKRSFELEKDIALVLADTGLPPERLELELTETVLMAASREHNDLLQWLRARGVRIAIDDFGVGYSSLDYLRRFPVDRIKIAQDFVEQIATASGAATIVKATIGLARELGIEVIAEGIETLEQLELLAGWRCREGQGFYFAPPLPAEDLTPLLSRGRLGARSASATDAA